MKNSENFVKKMTAKEVLEEVELKGVAIINGYGGTYHYVYKICPYTYPNENEPSKKNWLLITKEYGSTKGTEIYGAREITKELTFIAKPKDKLIVCVEENTPGAYDDLLAEE